MTMFGIGDNDIIPLVALVCGVDDREAVRERFARAAWSCMSEPGDRIAGFVVETLGAGEALTGMVERWPVERWAERLGISASDSASASPSALVSGSAFADAGPSEIAAALERWKPRLKSDTALRALRQAARYSARLLVPGDALWPAGVDDLAAFGPLALWWRGTDEAVAALDHGIALVGARAATGYGEHVTMEASAGLVDRGYAIVSGAAYGIDGMAHRAALASRGHTIAFLAGGVDRFYPSGHDALLTRIAETGAVMSEVPCGTAPTKWRFLQRNRLIAASSRATIVLEAGWRSGSLNTAGHAASLGRPLGAVPGPVTSAASAGCHRLIREFDAVCVTTPDEMAELAPLDGAAVLDGILVSPPDPQQVRLLDAMSARSARAASDIAERAGLAVTDVQAALGALELDGTVRQRENGWVRLR